MSQNYKADKLRRKQKRGAAIVERECNIKSSETSTRFLAVLNAGLCTGLTEELVLAAVTPHGEVKHLVMLPNKSYCFLEVATVTEAERIFAATHSKAPIGQNNTIVFLAYFEQLPLTSENLWQKPLPKGLFLWKNFVSEAEENMLLLAVEGKGHRADALKHRYVTHFGYEFLYGVNNVDPSQPLQQKIPNECDNLWLRFREMANEQGISSEWDIPDQLTVNEYHPGQGIPAHVDTHSAFRDPILALSLLGDVVMDFRRGSERIPIWLPRRSLLVMSGESRYDWTHGITPRNMDVMPTANGCLTTVLRTKRISLTFRCLRRGPCNCKFPMLCDTQLRNKPNLSTVNSEEIAIQLEEDNVHNVYDQIASHFSETRHTPWPQVASFLDSFEHGSVLLDVGCGNGKYLDCNSSSLIIGCDRSRGLLEVCTARRRNVYRCDCLQVPFRSQSIDGCISIAVIHHLATAERRLAAIREMARVLRIGGRGLIYVWAKNQRSGNKKSSYLLQNKAVNKHKITEEQQRQMKLQQQEETYNESSINLPIHTNRTDFLQQDVLVPWKLKNKDVIHTTSKEGTYLRYYHVFEEQELEQLVTHLPEVELLQSYYDQGNHCVIFQRK